MNLLTYLFTYLLTYLLTVKLSCDLRIYVIDMPAGESANSLYLYSNINQKSPHSRSNRPLCYIFIVSNSGLFLS